MDNSIEKIWKNGFVNKQLIIPEIEKLYNQKSISFVEKMISWSGVDVIATAERAAREFKKRRVTVCNTDATGVGAGVAPAMEKEKCAANPVKVASRPTQRSNHGEFYRLRDQLWWMCREWLRTDPGAMLPPDEQLVEELSVPTYSVENGRIRVMRKIIMRELLKRSPDRADALCLTFATGGLFAGCDLT